MEKALWSICKKLEGKFGNSKGVLAGSYIFNETHKLPTATADMGVLLLGMGPSMEANPKYSKYYEEILAWKKANPQTRLEVRLHPRSDGSFWRHHENLVDNLKVRQQNETFRESCQNSFVCLTSYTNAVVDAALVGRPSILICQ